MALRNQPYLPLYVQDFMTDEKLKECSPHASGIYIWTMCLMHKSEEYGNILLKQKYKFADDFAAANFPAKNKQILNFANQLAKQLPFSMEEIYAGLEELISEKVLKIENDVLIQKRMVKDEKISAARSKAGKKGNKAKQNNEQNKNFADDFAEANLSANSENEYEYESESEIDNSFNNLSGENFSKKIDPWMNPQKSNFEKTYEQVIGQKPVLMNEECINLAGLVQSVPDFDSTLEASLKKLKNINFEKIGYKPGADWFLKPKNYAALRNGAYDEQAGNNEKGAANGFTY